jgi:hypothetical protein
MREAFCLVWCESLPFFNCTHMEILKLFLSVTVIVLGVAIPAAGVAVLFLYAKSGKKATQAMRSRD